MFNYILEVGDDLDAVIIKNHMIPCLLLCQDIAPYHQALSVSDTSMHGMSLVLGIIPDKCF